mmetsp:Transcript_52335/g.114126  ORF Transcript_52335/g.114126 Transcript_52335/m.114126 type:complete len:294 (+) Transcript_52335:195-1076(+)
MRHLLGWGNSVALPSEVRPLQGWRPMSAETASILSSFEASTSKRKPALKARDCCSWAFRCRRVLDALPPLGGLAPATSGVSLVSRQAASCVLCCSCLVSRNVLLLAGLPWLLLLLLLLGLVLLLLLLMLLVWRLKLRSLSRPLTSSLCSPQSKRSIVLAALSSFCPLFIQLGVAQGGERRSCLLKCAMSMKGLLGFEFPAVQDGEADEADAELLRSSAGLSGGGAVESKGSESAMSGPRPWPLPSSPLPLPLSNGSSEAGGSTVKSSSKTEGGRSSSTSSCSTPSSSSSSRWW